MKRHAERFGTKLIYNHVDRVELGSRPFRLHCGRSEYTCDALIIATGASAKYLGLPTEEVVQGPRRVGVRDLRRLLLQEPAGRRGRRRQHGRRGSAVSLEHRLARHRRAPARRVPRRADHDRQAHGARAHRQRRDPLEPRARRGPRRRARRHRRAAQEHEESAACAKSPCRASSSRSATRRTRRSSKASSRWKAATSSRARAAKASRPRRASRASSRPATSRIRSIVRPSRRPGSGCMAALDAERFLTEG